MNLEELIATIKNLDILLSGMPKEIKDKCIVKTLPSQRAIIRKKDEIKYVYILCKGEINIVNEFKEGYMYVFTKAKVLDILGDQAVLADELEAAVTIETVSECTLIQLSRKDFSKWIQQDHVLAFKLLKKFAKRLYPSSRDKGIQLYYPSIYLIKRYLVKRFEELMGKEQLCLKNNRQQIANEIGISIKSLERGINKLKKEELVEVIKGKICMNQAQYESLVQLMED